MMTDAAQQLDMPLSIGQLLQNARLDANLSEDDVADHLRLSKNVIERIERDDMKGEDLTVFVRGYIRSYAKYVKVSLEEVEAYFQSMGAVDKPRRVDPANFTLKETSSKNRSMRFTTLGVIAVLVIMVLVWLFWQHDSSSTTSPTTAATASQTTQTAKAVEIPKATVTVSATAPATKEKKKS